MVRFFASGALILAASAVNAAEPPAAAAFAVIEACLADNRDSEQDRDSLCSGLIANPCQARPGGETTPGIVECLYRERMVWDALLNRYYVALIGRLDKSSIAALREAQRAWIPFRDKVCKFQWTVYRDGTIRGPVAASCLMEETARRAVDLKIWLEEMDR